MSKSQVIFSLGRGLYSFDSLKVSAVESGTQVNMIPGMPDCIMGLANLRGEMVPVCDLNKKFATGAVTVPGGDIIFVNTGDGGMGCTVDKVQEIGAVTEDIEIELPYLIRSDNTEYVAEIVRHKENLVTVIDADKLLSPEEREMVLKTMHRLRKDAADKKAEQSSE